MKEGKSLREQPNFSVRRSHRLPPWLVRYGVTVLLALALALGIMYARGLFTRGLSRAETLKRVSDGLFVSGILFFGVGSLIWVSSTGFFDMLSYGFKSVWYLFTPATKPRGSGGFYEYKLMKQERRENSPSVRHVALVGIVFVLFSAFFAVLYSNL